MHDDNYETDQDEIEYVGAPTEYADAQEMPEWVENLTKVFVALPALISILTTIPLVMLAVVLTCIMLVVVALIVL